MTPLLTNNKNFFIYPICAESRGVRSFCIQIKTPDISILLDPGCALGLRGKHKYPHPFEFQKLYDYTHEIVNLANESKYLFISHYHHDHFKHELQTIF
jgi:predicted metallo-beta-lactamase superfamily hydrolase